MTISIPVVKGHTLATSYWLGSMSFAALAKYVRLPDDDAWDPVFDAGSAEGGGRAQRRLDRARVRDEIVPYLVDNDDAFFSSLALVLVPSVGRTLEEGRDFSFEPADGAALAGAAGVLRLDESVEMFPADGQHRSAAIMEALRRQPERMARQEAPVVLLPYRGAAQVRQCFADLNLHARPAPDTMGYAFDSRDPVAVVTRRVASDVPLFRGRVNEASNSLSAKSPEVVALGTLVQAHEAMLAESVPLAEGAGRVALRDRQWLRALRGLDPSTARVGEAAAPPAMAWEAAIGSIPQWNEVVADRILPVVLREGDPATHAPGYVFAYGVGWQGIAVAAAALMRHRRESWPDDLARCVRSVDWRKGPHWAGVAMHGDRVVNSGPAVKATAGLLLRGGGLGAHDGVLVRQCLEALAKAGGDRYPLLAA